MTMLVRDALGKEYALDPGEGLTVSQAVYLSERFAVKALCSGLSRCGRCRVRYLAEAPAPDDTEKLVLGESAIAAGWRLGCRREARPGLAIEAPAEALEAPVVEIKARAADDSALAVDLGTTSIEWSVRGKGSRLASGLMLNPQLGAGSEVMSRLAFASVPGRARLLRDLAVSALKKIAGNLETGPASMCVAANQAMTCLLLGLPVQGLSGAPYQLCHTGGDLRELAPELPEAYIMPQISAFVGGDAAAGVTAAELGAKKPGVPYLLVDMGTNGEFILALPEGGYLAASVPLGPALEGVALSCGSVFEEGAITGFDLGPEGLSPVNGGDKPTGITGTGYISLISRLAGAGVLDEEGRFGSPRSPLARKMAARLIEFQGEKRLALPGGLHLSARDVEEVLKVKAAFNIAMRSLLDAAGVKAPDLKAVLLAGALGSHVRPDDLERLGFLPPGAAGLAVSAGNTSLAGAELCAADPEARRFAEDLPARTRVIDLVQEPDFGKRFMRAMRFEYLA